MDLFFQLWSLAVCTFALFMNLRVDLFSQHIARFGVPDRYRVLRRIAFIITFIALAISMYSLLK